MERGIVEGGGLEWRRGLLGAGLDGGCGESSVLGGLVTPDASPPMQWGGRGNI